MGEIRASVTLENGGDRAVVDRGHGVEADVRRTTVEGIVDTGVVSLVVPEGSRVSWGSGTGERELSSTQTSGERNAR